MRVLVVEDDPNLRTTLVEALRHEGYLVSEADEGGQALSTLATSEIDLVLLDRDLPGMNGDAVCRTMVSIRHPARILMLTAAADMAQRVAGLDLGADDYLAKPFQVPELLARCRALIRRSHAVASTELMFGDLHLDLAHREAAVDGRPLDLTHREWSILECLVLNAGRIVSRERLTQAVVNWSEDLTPNAIEVYISRLRTKLGGAANIRAVRGLGYRIDAQGH